MKTISHTDLNSLESLADMSIEIGQKLKNECRKVRMQLDGEQQVKRGLNGKEKIELRNRRLKKV